MQENEQNLSPRVSAEDTYSYRGWMNSDNFFKRAFAVLGYSLVAQLIISLVAGVLGVIVGLLGAGLFFAAG